MNVEFLFVQVNAVTQVNAQLLKFAHVLEVEWEPLAKLIVVVMDMVLVILMELVYVILALSSTLFLKNVSMIVLERPVLNAMVLIY